MRSGRRSRFPRRVALAVLAVAVMCGAAPAAATTQLVWAKSYDSGDAVGTVGLGIATDPGNGQVYVLARKSCCPFSTYETLAYSSAGTLLWHAESSTPEDLPAGIVVDPATHDVVVTGSRNRHTNAMYTIDYSSTGTVLWTRTLSPSSGRAISVTGIADDGHGRVDIVGTTSAGGTGDYLTAAYRISDGTKLWDTRYVGPDGDTEAYAVATDPGKNRVYVTGTSLGTNFPELTTVAYNAGTGAQVWAARDTGNFDVALGLAVDPTSHQVYALAYNSGLMVIHAYSSAGARLWDSGPEGSNTVAGYPRAGLAVDTSTGQVYVAGDNEISGGVTRSVLAAYSSAGSKLWSRNLHTGANDAAWDVTADSANHRAYVAAEREAAGGNNAVFATYAESSAGVSKWTATHASPTSGQPSEPSAITVDPTKKQVYVTGYENKQTSVVATLAYKP